VSLQFGVLRAGQHNQEPVFAAFVYPNLDTRRHIKALFGESPARISK
jgi:hypothetical protein